MDVDADRSSVDWLILPIKKATAGRARRKEFWMFFLFYILLIVFVIIVIFSVGTATFLLTTQNISAVGLIGFAVFFLFYGTVLITASLLVTTGVRRMHDQGYTGWLVMLGIIPLIGWVAVVILLALPGTDGPNKYGPDPKTHREIDPAVFA